MSIEYEKAHAFAIILHDLMMDDYVTDVERKRVMDIVTEECCTACGYRNPRCSCENDE